MGKKKFHQIIFESLIAKPIQFIKGYTMDTSIYQFEERESIVRDRWLKITVFNAALSLILSTILTFLKEEGSVLLISLLANAAPLAYTYWLYHCAYKHHGTKLLTFTLVLAVILIPLEMYGLTLKSEASMSIAFAVCLPFNILWMVISYQLRNIYKQKKKELALVKAK